MSHNPVLLIAAHPTRGVDVGAQAAIWDRVPRGPPRGPGRAADLADLDELIGLSDTLRGDPTRQAGGDADPATVTPEELGSAMTGADATGTGARLTGAAAGPEDEAR